MFNKFNKSNIPNLLTVCRFFITPIFFYTILKELYLFSIIIFIITAITDLLDGYIARKTDSVSDKGAKLDVWADFIFIIFSFLAFVIKGWYDPLVLVLIIVMFSMFLLTSPLKIPLYDPVGKYLGAFLMGMILLSLISPYVIILYPILSYFQLKIILIAFVFFCLVSIISRLFIFWRRSI